MAQAVRAGRLLRKAFAEERERQTQEPTCKTGMSGTRSCCAKVEEGFTVQNRCDGAEFLTSRTSSGMTRLGVRPTPRCRPQGTALQEIQDPFFAKGAQSEASRRWSLGNGKARDSFLMARALIFAQAGLV